MKKIYITSLHMMHGGVEMAITLLANALVKRGYEVEILCIYNLGVPVYELDERVKITYLTEVHPNREEFRTAISRKDIFAVLKEGIYALKVLYLKSKVLIRKFKKIQDGIVISTRNEHSILLSKYGNANVKKIAQLHHDHRFDKKLLNDFEKHYGRIDVFALLTQRLQKEVQVFMKKNTHTKCIVIPNFVENFENQEVIEQKNQILAVGRLHEVKGFERLILLWKKVEVDNKPVLKIIGDGEEKEKLECIIKRENMEKEVILEGALPHDKVLSEMSKSRFYVMTSFTEAFPFVLIEAMSQGLPVVAYDVRVGPEAIVEHEVNGYLIPDNQEEQYIEALLRLIKDETLRDRMSKAAYERAKQFTEENVMKYWLDILEDK